MNSFNPKQQHDISLFIDQMVNNEFDSDKDLAEFIQSNTEFTRESIDLMISKHRNSYMGSLKTTADFIVDYNTIIREGK